MSMVVVMKRAESENLRTVGPLRNINGFQQLQRSSAGQFDLALATTSCGLAGKGME